MDSGASTTPVAIDTTAAAAESSAVGAKRRKATKTNKVAQIQVSVEHCLMFYFFKVL